MSFQSPPKDDYSKELHILPSKVFLCTHSNVCVCACTCVCLCVCTDKWNHAIVTVMQLCYAPVSLRQLPKRTRQIYFTPPKPLLYPIFSPEPDAFNRDREAT